MSQGKRVRLSKRGLSCRARKTWAQAGRYALYFVPSPSHCCRRRIVALALSLLPRLDRPVAAALRATAKGRKRIPFRLRPGRRPLVSRFLSSENVRHGPGHQPGRGGRVAAVAACSLREQCAKDILIAKSTKNPIALGQRVSPSKLSAAHHRPSALTR